MVRGFVVIAQVLAANLMGHLVNSYFIFNALSKVSHHCLFKIIVDPIHQNKGVGNSLLKNVIHLAKVYFKLEEVYTEVVEDNPLIHLLHKYDFYQFAEQKDYVKENDRYYARLLFGISLI